MTDEEKIKIKEIMAEMKCPKNFKCAENNFKDLCDAKGLGIDSYLYCLDAEVKECPFAFPFGFSYMCSCPLRVYLATKI